MSRNRLRWLSVWLLCLPNFQKSDARWSEQLNGLLDEHEPQGINAHTCVLGEVEVWISNWPYSFGTPYRPSGGWLPDISTRIRLRDATEPKQRAAIAIKVRASLSRSAESGKDG